MCVVKERRWGRREKREIRCSVPILLTRYCMCLMFDTTNLLSTHSSLTNLSICSEFLVYFLVSTFRLLNLDYGISIFNVILLAKAYCAQRLLQSLRLALRLLVPIMLLHYKGLLIENKYNLGITKRLYLELYNDAYNINVSAIHSVKAIFIGFLLTLYKVFAGYLEYLVLESYPRVKEALNTL